MIASILVLALAGGPISADRAVEIALERSPGLRALALDLEEARVQVEVALELANPELRVAGLRSDRLLTPAFTESEYAAYPFAKTSLGLDWKPPNPWTRGATREKAERRVDEAAFELEEARRSLVARVRTLHATVLGLDAQLTLAKAAVDLRAELLGLVRRRLEQHAATALDESLADLDYLDALANRQELESRRRQVFHDLLVQLGLPAEDGVELAGGTSLECAAPPGDVAALYEKAKANSPRLRTYGARLSGTEAEGARLVGEVRPWLDSFVLGWVRGDEDTSSYASLRFNVTLPLLDWNGPDLRTLELKRARIAEEERQEVQALTSRVRRALEDRAEQAELVRRYREATPTLDEGLARLRQALDAAEADLLQIALVQTRVLAARRAHLRAVLDCRLTQIELDRLVGE